MSFWIGLLVSIVGISLLTWTWFYYHRTQLVPYLNKTIGEGAIIDPNKDVVLEPKLLPDLPKNYISPDLLKLKTWRAVHTIDPTDPLTINKITDKPVFTMNKDQVILSHSFTNSGLLSYLKPGDKVAISEGDKSLSDVLVLGKADKSGNILELLPALQNDSSGGNPISSALSSPNAAPPDSLIMLMTFQQSLILDQMKTPQLKMAPRPQMLANGGETSAQTVVNPESSQPR